MSLFSSLLGGVGAIAPFFGPVGAAVGAGAGVLGGLINSNQAQGQANKYSAMTNAQIKQMQEYYNSVKPVTGAAVDMALNPAQYTGPDPYSQDFQSASYNAYGEDATRAGDAGVSSLVNDYATRGIVGGTGIDRGIQGIRQGTESDLARFRSQLRERGAVANQQRFDQQQQDRFQRLAALNSTLPGAQSMIQNGIGGQQSIAQQQANSSSSALGGALGQLATGLGSITGAGSNRTGTNQPGQNPYFTPPFVPQQPGQYGFTGTGAYGFTLG